VAISLSKGGNIQGYTSGLEGIARDFGVAL
jgi:hypothetical protein